MRRLFVILFLCLPLITHGQSNNAGFVQGLWYDRDTIFADEPVRLYVAVRNNTGADMTGSVTFYADDNAITRKSVTALDGRIVESWADWTPTYGEHTLRAELSRLELTSVDGGEERITVTSPLAEDVIFVDYDTDGDGVGNNQDTDDDNDGITDEEEAAAGTDPLVANEPEVIRDEEAETDDTQGSSSEEQGTIATDAPQGLEQYLTPSRANTLLSSITDWTNETKEQLDTYRDERSYEVAVDTNDPDITVNPDGFGEVVRSSSSGRAPAVNQATGGGIVGDLITLIGTIVTGIITAVLTSLSILLSSPVLIQLLLLFGLLLIIYRLAKRYGGRPG